MQIIMIQSYFNVYIFNNVLCFSIFTIVINKKEKNTLPQTKHRCHICKEHVLVGREAEPSLWVSLMKTLLCGVSVVILEDSIWPQTSKIWECHRSQNLITMTNFVSPVRGMSCQTKHKLSYFFVLRLHENCL